MDREIRFRGKRADNGEWAYGDLEYNRAKSIARIHSYDDNGNYIGQNVVDESTVGQFTGLKDCNGKEIYEGDILSLDDWIKPCEVIWNNEVASFKIRYIVEDGFCTPKDSLGYWVQDHKDSVCVIGNVYDNSDLLK